MKKEYSAPELTVVEFTDIFDKDEEITIIQQEKPQIEVWKKIPLWQGTSVWFPVEEYSSMEEVFLSEEDFDKVIIPKNKLSVKEKIAKKRRLDAKFKAKSFKKAHRLATNPATGKQDLVQMAKFYEGAQNKRHPGKNFNRPSKAASKIVNENIKDLIEEAEDILYDEGALLYEDEPWYIYNPETRSWDFDDNEFEFQQMLSDEYGEEDFRLEEETRAEWAPYLTEVNPYLNK